MKEYLYRLATDQKNGFPARCLKALLLPLAGCYGWAVKLVYTFHRCGILRTHQLPKPVISIGNITLGGVGKTPLVLLVAEYLSNKRARPVILIRGYMDERPITLKDPRTMSDEALTLEAALENVPVMIGRDRLKSARRALKEHGVDVFILDDGFQHWRLHRNLDIVAIDTTNPFGNGQLIPRGTLREPVDALKRANLFVLTKVDAGKDNIERIIKKIRELNSEAPIVQAVHVPVGLMSITHPKRHWDLQFLRGKKVCGFCGIGDPSSFKNSLLALGAEVVAFIPFMDHHCYTESDIHKILDEGLKKGATTLITTEKDKVKLEEFKHLFKDDQELLFLKIKIEITQGKDEFFHRITHIL